MPDQVPETLTNSIGWIALVSALLLAGIAALIHQLIGRVRAIEERLAALDELARIRAELSRAREGGAAPSLAPLEGVLVDLRDSQRRLAERIVELFESTRREAPPSAAPTDPGASAERIVNRLLAMGYERIHLISSSAEVAEAFAADGVVRVEARREGVACKGRVRVEGGRIVDADLTSAHSTFP